MQEWVLDEMQGVDFGDKRLGQRVNKLLDQLSRHPQASIPQACGGWGETQAAYRFFNNDKVSFEEILAAHREATLKRVRACEVVLALQDTSELDFSVQGKLKGIGTLREIDRRKAYLHPVLAVTPERVSLGTVWAKYWEREDQAASKQRRSNPIEYKESVRWIEGYEQACALAGECPNSLIVSVSDREGDIYELLEEPLSYEASTRAAFIIRAAQDRCVQSSEASGRLWDRLDKFPVLGYSEFILPGQGSRKSRSVVQSLRALEVTLCPPERKGQNTLKPVKIYALLAREENPPSGEDAIEWLLLTNLEISTLEQAQTVLNWYVCRWEIEIYFRVLKSGCEIEELQLQTPDRRAACLALYLIIAWRVLFLTRVGRACPDLPCDIVFDTQEWQAVYIVTTRHPPSTTPPTLNEMILMIACLGGYLNRKHDEPPGPKSIWIGLQRTHDFAIALNANKQAYRQTCV